MSPSKDPPTQPGGGKIAMKGFSLTAKPNSASKSNTKTKVAAPPSSNLGKRRRATFQHDSESDDERDGGRRRGGHEAVTGFGEGGAIVHRERDGDGEGRRGGELVIKKMANRDWRGEARSRGTGSGRDLLPPEARAERDAVARERGGQGNGGEKKEGVDVVNGNDDAIQWGLSVRKRARTDDDDAEGGDANGTTTQDDKDNPDQPPPQPKTADEEALASLLGQQTSQSRPVLTIPAPAPPTEQEAYKAAVASAPDPSSLEDYERIPVEEFGAALLRGMGWKGEKTANARPKDVKRRQNLLGLGAKELDGAEELGAWVQKSDIKRLNPGGGKGGGSGFGGGGGNGERRQKAGEYKREKERERERREERGGGGYRGEKEREREREREGGYRDRDSGRDRHREYRR